MGIARSWRWALVPVLAIVIAGCGIKPQGPAAGQPTSVNLKLSTVPTIRSVTVTVLPSDAKFANCSGGRQRLNTRSTSTQLGYPNGRCWVGSPDPVGSFPIKITNTGIASYIDVNGSNASPSDEGDQWGLCNLGGRAPVTCKGHDHHFPGSNQYLVQNFGPQGTNYPGLTTTPECDRLFSPAGRCWAVQGASQVEGIELTGPRESSDNSTRWTVTITWTPVPGNDQ